MWCEKPMAVKEKECQAMIDACKKNKKSLAIGYRLQHEPNTMEYRRIVNNKLLGNVKQLSDAAGYRDNRTDHWKQKREMGGEIFAWIWVYMPYKAPGLEQVWNWYLSFPLKLLQRAPRSIKTDWMKR